MTQPVDSASLSRIIAFLRTGGQFWCNRGIKAVSLRVEVSWSPCERGFNFSAGSHACHPAGRLPREQGWPAWAETPPHRLHPRLLRPSCYHCSLDWLCFSRQPTFHGWGGGEEGANGKKRLWVLRRHPQPWGRWGKGPPSTGELACLVFGCVDCPPICSLWRRRGRVP